MSEKLEVVKGSGNVFRDLGEKDVDIKKRKHYLPPKLSLFELLKKRRL